MRVMLWQEQRMWESYRHSRYTKMVQEWRRWFVQANKFLNTLFGTTVSNPIIFVKLPFCPCLVHRICIIIHRAKAWVRMVDRRVHFFLLIFFFFFYFCSFIGRCRENSFHLWLSLLKFFDLPNPPPFVLRRLERERAREKGDLLDVNIHHTTNIGSSNGVCIISLIFKFGGVL